MFSMEETKLRFQPPTLKPALLPSVHLGLTVTFTTLYAFLFIIIYVQLWMILYYKHRRFSYQSVFLFLCLFWSGLRTTLFSFYFKNAEEANVLPTFLYWLLYCFPVCLQFMTLCLLVIFFAQVNYRQIIDYVHTSRLRVILLGCTALAIAVFLVTNITCAVLIDRKAMSSETPSFALILTRVLVNDMLFILYALLLSICIYKVSKLPTNFQVLESQGTTRLQAVMVGVFLVLLYISRAVYNIIAVTRRYEENTFGYSWINVSDQADVNSAENSYLAFGVILFLWEFLPTFIVVFLFRVKRPKNEMHAISTPAGGSEHITHAYFFDNPRRYDSDDDLSRSHHSGNSEDVPPTSINVSIAQRSLLASEEVAHPQGTPPVLSANTGPLSSRARSQPLYGDT